MPQAKIGAGMAAKSRKAGRAVTAAQVGRLAGVSQSAVSRAFTPGRSIASKTRERILKAAEQLGYQPNFIARSLMTRRSNIIGLAVGPLDNPFYAALVKELAHALRASGRHLLFFPAASQTNPDPAIDEVLSYQVDALVLASTTLSSKLAERCDGLGIPVLLINRLSPFASVSTIAGQNRLGGETIAHFLVAGGHRRLAFIAGLESTSTSRDREAGFVSWLQANGMALHAREVGNYSIDDAARATRSLLSRGEPPDAIFAANDFMAISTINVIRKEFGLSIPDDISVVGFDGLEDGLSAGYELTSFSQPVSGFVARVITILDSLIAEPAGMKAHLEVPGELIVGATARRPCHGIVERNRRLVWESVGA
jgi:DNA-binding LacI/PurR family transcriptional regulator